MSAPKRRACDPCNVRKVKCIPLPGSEQCTACAKSSLRCTYINQHKRSGPRSIRRTAITKINRIQNSAGDAEAVSFRRIPVNVLKHGIELYRQRLYGIWPLLNATELVFNLENDACDKEIYCLCTALCAATLSELHLQIADPQLEEPLTAQSAVAECIRVRTSYDYMEAPTINTVLTSYFLHMYHGKQKNKQTTAVIFIREAITFAQLLNLHVESHYAVLPIKDQCMRRKLYYLLFMTERYLCIHFGLPVVLDRIELPDIAHEESPDAVSGFLNLVRLFSLPDKSFFEQCSSAGSRVDQIPREALMHLQRQLERPMKIPTRSDDIQKVDVVVSRHWIRSLAWKLSIVAGHVTHDQTNRSMSITYPADIARDMLVEIQTIPKEVFEVHGPGMEVKLFEVANSLADVVIWQPKELEEGYMFSYHDLLLSVARVVCQVQVKNAQIRKEFSTKLEKIALAHLSATAKAAPLPKISIINPVEHQDEDEPFGPATTTSSPRDLIVGPSPVTDVNDCPWDLLDYLS